MDSKNVIGEVNVNVNAGLSVDERTFHICLDLVAIHAQNEGLKALVLIMPEDHNSHCSTVPIYTSDGLGMMFDRLDSSDAEQKARG